MIQWCHVNTVTTRREHTMYQTRDMTYTEAEEAIILHENQTLKGIGRRGHGLNGKDADLNGGQIVVREAWWHPEAVTAVVYAYATEPHEEYCEGCESGDCDG